MVKLITILFLLYSCASIPQGPTLKFEGYPIFIKGVTTPIMVRIQDNLQLPNKELKSLKATLPKKIVNELEWIENREQLTQDRVMIELNIIQHDAIFKRPNWHALTKVRAEIWDKRQFPHVKKSFKIFTGVSKVFGLSDLPSKNEALSKSWKSISEEVIKFFNSNLNQKTPK